VLVPCDLDDLFDHLDRAGRKVHPPDTESREFADTKPPVAGEVDETAIARVDGLGQAGHLGGGQVALLVARGLGWTDTPGRIGGDMPVVGRHLETGSQHPQAPGDRRRCQPVVHQPGNPPAHVGGGDGVDGPGPKGRDELGTHG
jgi:hypothetical protein